MPPSHAPAIWWLCPAVSGRQSFSASRRQFEHPVSWRRRCSPYREPLERPAAHGADRSSVLIHVPKVVLQDVLGNLAAQAIAFLHRMAIVHSAVDARVVDLGDHIIEALERVSGTGDYAVHGECD